MNVKRDILYSKERQMRGGLEELLFAQELMSYNVSCLEHLVKEFPL